MHPSSLIFLIVLFALFWVLMVLPQRRQQKQRQQLQQQVQPGVRVLTYSGLYGDVVRVDGGHVFLRIAPEVVVDMDIHAVARIVEADSERADSERDEPPANTSADDAAGIAGASETGESKAEQP